MPSRYSEALALVRDRNASGAPAGRFGKPLHRAPVEQLCLLSRYQSPYDAYRTIMADSASVCPLLRTNQELSRYIPVHVDINTDADKPGG